MHQSSCTTIAFSLMCACSVLFWAASTSAATEAWVNNYDDVSEGSFFTYHDGEPGYQVAPLLDTQVSIQVTGFIARARVVQTFSNPIDQWINGIYVFPLPETAAVDRLSMQVGERQIIGEIHPKRQAKAIYEQAQKAGKKASLLTQQRPNLFTNSVANIGPGEKVIVTIEYQQAVTYTNGVFSLRFPSTVTERYLPFGSSLLEKVKKVEIDSSGWQLKQPAFTEQDRKIAIDVSLQTGLPLDSINSDTHAIQSSQIAEGQYQVTLRQGEIANRDFVLSWQSAEHHQPMAAHFTQATSEGFYGMLMLMPANTQVADTELTREVIFIVDTSGSMAGLSIEQAKQALMIAIEALSASTTFNIIEFNSTANKVWPASQLASRKNKQGAIRFIQGLRANGGTEMLPALKLALDNQDTETSAIRQVIFMTDGAVGNETALFSYIQSALGNSRLFTVGIGSAPNSYFMRETARSGKGTFTFISDVNQVKERMQALFEKLARPALTDLAVDFAGEVEVYPKHLPDLYHSEPIVLSYYSAEPIHQLNLSGRLKHQHWQQTVSLKASRQPDKTQNGLNVLWARRKIVQLEHNKLNPQQRDYESQLTLNQKIESVALRHHLVSSMTSLVAVDTIPSALATSSDSQILQARPYGQTRGRLPQTATNAGQQFYLALLFLSLSLCFTLIKKSR